MTKKKEVVIYHGPSALLVLLYFPIVPIGLFVYLFGVTLITYCNASGVSIREIDKENCFTVLKISGVQFLISIISFFVMDHGWIFELYLNYIVFIIEVAAIYLFTYKTLLKKISNIRVCRNTAILLSLLSAPWIIAIPFGKL